MRCTVFFRQVHASFMTICFSVLFLNPNSSTIMMEAFLYTETLISICRHEAVLEESNLHIHLRDDINLLRYRQYPSLDSYVCTKEQGQIFLNKIASYVVFRIFLLTHLTYYWNSRLLTEFGNSFA
jgi:hypothetical protein